MTSPIKLADRYAAANEAVKAAEEILKALKAEINALGQPELVGDYAIVTLGLSERSNFDAATAKGFLSADQIVACTKTALVSTIRVKTNVSGKVAA
jgi:hypothetical protein